MADYIDREALYEDIRNSVVFSVRNAPSAEMRGANKILDRIKCAPAADVAPVEKDLRPTVRLLHREYERAKKNPIVRNPMAYALYQVWKAVDDCENGR